MLPPPLHDLTLRVAALDGGLGDRVADVMTRMAVAAEALAWARDRVPELMACLGRSDILDLLVREADQLTHAPEVWAVMWTGTGDAASLAAISGRGGSDSVVALGDALRTPRAVSRSLVSRVLREGRPAWSDDARVEAELRGAHSIQLASLRSVGCVPVGSQAVLYLADASAPARFGAEVRARLAALGELAGMFLAQAPTAVATPPELPGLVGSSRALRDLAAAVRAFAPMPWPALVLGETGTGKEAVARALHACSPRKDRPFVAINCGAMPDELAESLLFGHERGAFTGADRRRDGVVELVGDGTLFLDEVGELSPRAQVKLLRLLQEGTFSRLGGDRELKFEGRIVAATLRPIDVPGDAFRADLYHRLAACVLRVPPLRDRRDDIPALADHLVRRSLAQLPGAPALDIAPDVLRWLQAADWPGNIRDLENALRGAIARAIARGATRLQLVDVATAGWAVAHPSLVAVETPPVGEPPPPPPGPPPPLDRTAQTPSPAPPATAPHPTATDLAGAVAAAQRDQVLAALAACGGNKSAAARRLGVSRQWLYTLLERWSAHE